MCTTMEVVYRTSMGYVIIIGGRGSMDDIYSINYLDRGDYG